MHHPTGTLGRLKFVLCFFFLVGSFSVSFDFCSFIFVFLVVCLVVCCIII